MATVELRGIVTEDDCEAVMGLRLDLVPRLGSQGVPEEAP